MLDQLQTLVRQIAHTEVMPHFLAAETSIKQDGSILSTADLATQAALVRGLRQIIDCPVLGEEMTEQERDEKDFEELWESPEWDLFDKDGWMKHHMEIGRFFFLAGRRTLREKEKK